MELHRGPLSEMPIQLKSQLSRLPDTAWDVIADHQVSLPPPCMLTNASPKPEGHLRFVAISDTHNQMDRVALPQGDVLLHCGDFTNMGKPEEIAGFVRLFAATNFKYRISESDTSLFILFFFFFLSSFFVFFLLSSSSFFFDYLIIFLDNLKSDLRPLFPSLQSLPGTTS